MEPNRLTSLAFARNVNKLAHWNEQTYEKKPHEDTDGFRGTVRKQTHKPRLVRSETRGSDPTQVHAVARRNCEEAATCQVHQVSRSKFWQFSSHSLHGRLDVGVCDTAELVQW